MSEASRQNPRLKRLLDKRVRTLAEIERAQTELAAAQERCRNKTVPCGGLLTIAGREYAGDDLQGHVRGWRQALQKERGALRSINAEIAKEDRKK